MGRIEGKACIVTGAASGIGRATAVRFAEEGGRVLCVDVAADLGSVVAEIRDAGGTADQHVADVSDARQVQAFVDGCAERWGAVDVLVNNAGVNLPGVLHEVPDEVIDRTLAVNVKGPIYGCRAAIPHMLRQGGGSIVNVSSVNGIVSEPFLAVYSASKGAVVMLTKGVALDYAQQGIRCNAICPGWVDTPINHAHAALLGGLQHVYDTIGSFQPIGRPGEPREIAHVALFLASDEASFLTGSIVVADGGMTSQ
ncbi:MAG: SDR family oxidoreductase [Acidimicrobiales bacterium]|nr:SDR family oxidoreductase [Acidimicrobiales bacterium]